MRSAVRYILLLNNTDLTLNLTVIPTVKRTDSLERGGALLGGVQMRTMYGTDERTVVPYFRI